MLAPTMSATTQPPLPTLLDNPHGLACIGLHTLTAYLGRPVLTALSQIGQMVPS